MKIFASWIRFCATKNERMDAKNCIREDSIKRMKEKITREADPMTTFVDKISIRAGPSRPSAATASPEAYGPIFERKREAPDGDRRSAVAGLRSRRLRARAGAADDAAGLREASVGGGFVPDVMQTLPAMTMLHAPAGVCHCTSLPSPEPGVIGSACVAAGRSRCG